ncbi:uncharacterized protein LOC111915581 [Lactuca sativa]|uniref:uncharacterized protein LOC111915581 n=1 Tax=Lactuca sativa TaxID=4236 RepID=UPI001C68C51F|nr:uncharacterized protein LOC111915581 [Lactuca sativa]
MHEVGCHHLHFVRYSDQMGTSAAPPLSVADRYAIVDSCHCDAAAGEPRESMKPVVPSLCQSSGPSDATKWVVVSCLAYQVCVDTVLLCRPPPPKQLKGCRRCCHSLILPPSPPTSVDVGFIFWAVGGVCEVGVCFSVSRKFGCVGLLLPEKSQGRTTMAATSRPPWRFGNLSISSWSVPGRLQQCQVFLMTAGRRRRDRTPPYIFMIDSGDTLMSKLF